MINDYQQRFAGPCLAIVFVVVVAVVVVVVVVIVVIVIIVIVVVVAVCVFLRFWGFLISFMVSPLLFYIDFPCLALSRRLGFFVVLVVSVFLPFALFGT